ncbi:MAG TPA: hypothetical protein VFW80_08230, partial [Gaiellaceae bacterium]|nr:hypothetical protein [Gaiellaceae bacterium]
MQRPIPRIHVTRSLPEAVMVRLEGSFILGAETAGAAGLLTTPADTVDEAFLDVAGPGLRVVANFGVGYDSVDLEAATRRGIVVTNTPDVLTEATAELTIALVL